MASQTRHITLPAGFRAAGVKCGIKASGREDLALLVADKPAAAAVVTTQNQVVGAPVIWCRQILPRGYGRLRAMVAKQEDLARMTGISRSTISALEDNRLFLSSPYALLIAEALRCRLDDLYDRQNSGSGLSPTDGPQGL